MAIKDHAHVNGHYVYLYRDVRGKVRYVGYGEKPSRATVHLSRSHNELLTAFLAKGKYELEIAGPFGTEEIGRAVETVLISALKPDCNRAPGQTRWIFRPLGVPESFVDRLNLPPLTRSDFLQPREGVCPGPVLFVYISSKNFEDRPGYDLAKPPTDEQILDRMVKWWELGKHVARWSDDFKRSPALLVGVSGSPDARIVIGFCDCGSIPMEICGTPGWSVPSSVPRAADVGCRTVSWSPDQYRGKHQIWENQTPLLHHSGVRWNDDGRKAVVCGLATSP